MDTINTIMDFFPQYKTYFIVAGIAIPLIGRAWKAWKNNGGFKGVWNAIVCGTNVPSNTVIQKEDLTHAPIVEQPK